MLGDYFTEIVTTGISMVIGGFTWLVRTVLTNQRQIDLLQQEIRSRDSQRKEDRQVLMEVQKDVKEVKRDIMELYRDKL